MREALEDALRPPWFPVALAETPSEKSYEEVLGAGFDLGPARVTPLALNHPQGAIGYRFDVDGSSLAIATDHESANGDVDRAVIEWARGTDVLLHDAQYTRVDYEAHEGWGHSTWESAVDTAIAAEVGQLVTVSHDPSRTDDELDDLTRRARERFPRTRAGAAGTRISVGA